MKWLAAMVACLAAATAAGRESRQEPWDSTRGRGGANCSQVLRLSASEQLDLSFSPETHGGLYCVLLLRGPPRHKLVLMLTAGDFRCNQDSLRVYSLAGGRLSLSAQLCNGSTSNVVTDENVALLTFNAASNATRRTFRVVAQLLQNYLVPSTLRPGALPSWPPAVVPAYGQGPASYDCDGQPWVVGASGLDRGWQDWGGPHSGNDLASWLADTTSGEHWSKKIHLHH